MNIILVSANGLDAVAWMQALGRFHVAVVHFPIALLLLAALVELGRIVRRKPDPSPISVSCLVAGLAGAIAAAAFGWFHKDFVRYSGEQARVLTWHQWLGIITTALAAVAAMALVFRNTRGIPFRVTTLACAALVAFTAHLGGTLTHGPGYLTELFTPTTPAGPVGDVMAASLVSEQLVPLEQVQFPADGKVDFVRHVQPIFANTCYECHGPSVRRGSLRLDSKPAVLEGGNSGPALLRGDSEQSLLIRRVRGLDGQKQMPLGHPPLSDEHVKILRSWIDQGAHWPDDASNEQGEEQIHWAYLKPVRPNLPAVQNTSWPRNGIDHFVLARLEKEGLAPSPEADRATLIRRVSLDLTGLPPTPQEVDDFVNDPSFNAYEKVVDRLLASPHYGERWGRHWLDLARYADTNGYEKDRPRQIWAYRDWVIKALNDDMPFNQFTIEQVAGDMLPDATQDQRIASGFHRNTMFNEEGGIDVEEFRYESTVDRVRTTSTAFLGLTMHCAQCHTHKYDAISHDEYFRFFALLNNADEPTMQILSEQLAAKRQEIDEQIAALNAQLEANFPTHDEVIDWEVLTAERITSTAETAFTRLEDGSYLATDVAPPSDTYSFEVTIDPDRVGVVRLEVMPDDSLPQNGPGRAANGNFVLSQFSATIQPTSGGEAQPLNFAGAEADYSQPKFPVADSIDGKPGGRKGWAIVDGATPGAKQRTALYRLPEQLKAGPVKLVLKMEHNYGAAHSIGRFRLALGRIQPPPESDLPPEQQRANHLARKLAEWEASMAPKAVQWTVLDPQRYWRYHNATITRLEDKSLLYTGDSLYRDQYDIEFVLDQPNITAIRLEALPHEELPSNGPGRNESGSFRIAELHAAVAPVDQVGPAAPLKFKRASADPETQESAPRIIDGQKDTHWTVPGGGNPRTLVLQLEEPLAHEGPMRFSLALVQFYFSSESPGRLRISVASDPRETIEAAGVPAEIEAILLVPAEQRSEQQIAQVRQYFLQITPALAPQRQEIEKLRQSRPAYPTTLVMKERDNPRITRLHHRGEFLQPRHAVEPGVPAVLHPLPQDQPPDRLALARWLVSDENPLIGRVTVNRIWSHYFGRGIVSSVEDFGVMGDPPSHPELLDWLATELPRQDWSLKAIHRLIVTSASYRQSSHVKPIHREKDPLNVLLARMPRLRVEAEVVRDVALAASGLLNPQIGGPSVYPPQPEGVSQLSYGPLNWPTSTGPDRYRRGMYTFIKRTQIYPGLTIFDAPTSETTCARRIRSNTPLQALTTLNDEVFVEAAQGMAQRVMTQGPADVIGKAELAFRLCLARKPLKRELEQIVFFYQSQLRRFRDGSVDPAPVALLDPSKPPENVDLPELAAWTTVARVVLNLDETLTKE